jgi:hypothetical protein
MFAGLVAVFWGMGSFASVGLAPHFTQRATEETAAATDDPELYATERWGHFSYAIPVPSGKYAMTLYFIERRFRRDHGKAGSDPDTTDDAAV